MHHRPLTPSLASSCLPMLSYSWALNSKGRAHPGKWFLRMYHSAVISADILSPRCRQATTAHQPLLLLHALKSMPGHSAGLANQACRPCGAMSAIKSAAAGALMGALCDQALPPL